MNIHQQYIAILVWMATMVLTPRLNGEHMMINLNGKLGTPNLWDSLGKNEKRRVASRKSAGGVLYVPLNRFRICWKLSRWMVKWIGWIWRGGMICLRLSCWIWSRQCFDLSSQILLHNPWLRRQAHCMRATCESSRCSGVKVNGWVKRYCSFSINQLTRKFTDPFGSIWGNTWVYLSPDHFMMTELSISPRPVVWNTIRAKKVGWRENNDWCDCQMVQKSWLKLGNEALFQSYPDEMMTASAVISSARVLHIFF